jgi:hypothetical protein
MISKGYDLKLLELFKEQKIFEAKKRYSSSLNELWDLDIKTTKKVARAATCFTSALIFFGFNNLDYL